MSKTLLVAVGACVVVFLLYVVCSAAAAQWVEDRILFVPPPRVSDSSTLRSNGSHNSTTTATTTTTMRTKEAFVRVPRTNERLHVVVARPAAAASPSDEYDGDGGCDTTVLYSHGNAEDLSTHAPLLEWFVARGVNVLLWDYLGYGRSSGGKPSEAAVHRGVLAVYDWYRRRWPAQRIVAHGFSLGGGAATYLAAHRPVDGLVLEATFVSVCSVPTDGVRLSLVDRFDNAHWLARLPRALPVLLAHGTADDMISHRHSQRLHAALVASRRGAHHRARLLLVDGGDHYAVRKSAAFWPAWQETIGAPRCAQRERAHVRAHKDEASIHS